MTPVRDSDEELFELKELYQRLQMENQTFRAEQEGFHRELTEKQHLIERYDHEMRKQIETVAQLNQEVLHFVIFLTCFINICSFVRSFVRLI